MTLDSESSPKDVVGSLCRLSFLIHYPIMNMRRPVKKSREVTRDLQNGSLSLMTISRSLH